MKRYLVSALCISAFWLVSLAVWLRGQQAAVTNLVPYRLVPTNYYLVPVNATVTNKLDPQSCVAWGGHCYVPLKNNEDRWQECKHCGIRVIKK